MLLKIRLYRGKFTYSYSNFKIDTQKIKMKSKSCFSSSRFVKVGAVRNFSSWLFNKKLPSLCITLWKDSIRCLLMWFYFTIDSFFRCDILYIAFKIFNRFSSPSLGLLLASSWACKEFLRFTFFRGSLHFPRICWHGNLYQKWISNSVNKVIVERERERVNRHKLVVWEEDFAHT